MERSWGQRIYADVERDGSAQTLTGSAGVVLASNAVSASLTDSCRLTTGLVALGTATAYVQLIFSTSSIPANATVFVKYNSSVALGGGLAVQAYSGSSSTADGSTVATTSTAITGSDGSTYFAVSSTSPFNAVRITLSAPAVGTKTADIFYGFYLPSGVGCNKLYTATSATGVTLANISNPNQAIDGNVTTYSTFDFTLSLGGTLTQSVFLEGYASSNSAATLAISVPPAVLSLGLFSSINVKLWKGATQVGTTTPLSSLLSLDLLGLLANGSPYNISIAPGD